MSVDLARALAIPGWMSPEELTWLAEQAQAAQVVVEIGSWKGRSTMALADHCPGTVYAIDSWSGPCLTDRGRVHPLKTNVYAEFRKHLRWHLTTGKVKALRLPSSRGLARLTRQLGRVADLLFIDGDHRYQGVKADIVAALSLLKPGGLLCGHDYTNAEWPGVKRAVDEALGWPPQLVGSILVGAAMTIAVTLLTCGRVDYTRKTLESFAAQHPDARSEFLLLQADDASAEPEILELAAAHGFETVVRNPTRRGVRALRAAVVAVAAARGADWVLVLENDWEWARPFPWALFRHLVATRPDVYHLRLYGAYKDRARALRCWTMDMSRNRRPVTWTPLAGAPEPAEAGFIHWGAPPAVTRIAEATALCVLPPGTGYDGSGDTHEMMASGRLKLKVARVVENVVYHIGHESSHRAGRAARRPAVMARARAQRAYTFGAKAKAKPPLYTPAWQQTRTWTSTGSTRCLEIALATLERPASLLDVGCGDGHLVTRARHAGVESVGVDLSAEGAAHADLREPLDLQRTFDWVFCWEVAEHLPEESADTLCDSVVRHLAPGGHLLFTAAHPGQRGDGHVNEQPQVYWRDKLAARGLTYDAVTTHKLSAAWLREAPKTPWYGTNLQVFTAPGTRVRVTPPAPRIAITMRTANRAPKPNYVGGTVRRLVEQGVDPASIHLCVTSPDTAWLDAELGGLQVTRHVPAAKLTPNQNGLEQIRVLDPLAYDWVLLLEDDLAFCADFLGSVARWLQMAARPDRHVYRLFTFRVRPPGSKRTAAYDWPLKNMCGTQAVLLRMADAQDFLAWADANLETWGGFRGNPRIAFDKLMAAWALHQWPDRPGVMSHPFFVKHVGLVSSIHPAASHMDQLFAGARWAFRPQEATA